MVGKASLLLVLGFSLIFLVFGQRFVSLSGQATDNMVDYYSDAVAHECASAGANMATTEFFRNQSWSAGFNNLDFNGGKINVTIQRSANIVITSIGTYRDITHKDVVTFSNGSFSRYAYFSTMENDGPGNPPIWWTPNDTVWGPFHTQDYMYVYNHPVFLGPVSTAKNLVYYNYYQKYPSQLPQNPTNYYQRRDYNNSIASDAPVFKGGFDPATNNPMPLDGLADIKAAAQLGGFYIPKSQSTITVHKPWGTYTQTVDDTAYITFNNNQVIIKMGYSKSPTTYNLSDVAPNGVLYVQGMNVRLKGTVEGQYTVAGEGSIFLDDNIVYKKDPRQHSNSTDLLGIVANDNVLIANNDANNIDGINIDAAIYCQTGGFGAEDYNTRPFSHYINLLGGITQYKRQAVGTFGGYSGNTGFYKRYRYDQRLWDKLAPPYYPHTEKPTILSWLSLLLIKALII
ncbi:MAG: hypothetical protein P8Z35_14035 [Ignavibacteriaceae bacterium]